MKIQFWSLIAVPRLRPTGVSLFNWLKQSRRFKVLSETLKGFRKVRRLWIRLLRLSRRKFFEGWSREKCGYFELLWKKTKRTGAWLILSRSGVPVKRPVGPRLSSEKRRDTCLSFLLVKNYTHGIALTIANLLVNGCESESRVFSLIIKGSFLSPV